MPAVDARREAAARRWRGAIIGTLVLQLSYQPLTLIRAAFRGADVDPGLVGNAFGFGLGVMPIVFIVVAFVSRHLRAPTAVLKGMVLFLVIGMPLYLVIDPIVGATAGFVAGGVVTLRPDFGPHTTQARIVTAVTVVLVVLLLVTVIDALAAAIGAIAPFLALAYSDQRVARQHPETDDDEDALLEE